MTPYDLEKSVSKAEQTVANDRSRLNGQIFHLLCVLLRHEADKEAELNLQRHHAALTSGDRHD